MIRIDRFVVRGLLPMLMCWAPFTALHGQTLTPGTRVRVKSPQVVAPIIGSFQGMHQDTLVVIEDGQAAQVWNFARGAIDRLEVSAGMKGGNRRPMTRWALIGAAGGAVLGWGTAAILEGSSSSQYNDALSALVGAGVGAGLGALYGARILEEHWTGVPVPRRVSLLPVRGGFRIGIAAGF